MNKNEYVKAMEYLKISEDFKERTAMKMKEAKKIETGNSKNTYLFRKLAVSAAGVMLLAATGAIALHQIGSTSPNRGNNMFVTESTPDAGVIQAKGITVPTIKLPSSKGSAAADMRLLFVYKGHIYIQSATTFETGADMIPSQEDVLALKGDYLGKTTGKITEWSSQDDYATEFASNIGEGEVYTVKGYDSDHRLMVYQKYQDGGFSCELYDSFGGLTMNTGADYFNLLNLKGNIDSYQWQSFNSWNNGTNIMEKGLEKEALNTFIDSLYTATPLGENIDMLTQNTAYDSQKFVKIKTNDKLITTLRLFKGGYVYDSQVGFFKVDDKAFQTFWDTMPVTDSAAKDTAASTSLDFTIPEASLPVGAKEIKAYITNTGSEDIFFGVDYSIEQLNGTEWATVPGISDMAFIDIAYSVAPADKQEFRADLSQLKPSLKAGNYRLVKTINGQTFYAEFKLK